MWAKLHLLNKTLQFSRRFQSYWCGNSLKKPVGSLSWGCRTNTALGWENQGQTAPGLASLPCLQALPLWAEAWLQNSWGPHC